ncbi:hypothetical protein B0T25DRAFT_623170 [Lasiosphaeria hispida]|uniref:Zn(2)-C6 fungal-type domain-containing protein n=1 Tax=Lasiosphaeria hispida TaxID=260671 RepID=A0AAJ0HHZ1_9PEZI|nr:hypothetical protein B0T25DRAFT_623170 [Lasiosphaeria hispida]
MEALLSASKSNQQCSSVADLQDQLRGVFSTRVTETTANHIELTFELRPTTVFHVPVSENGNEALENASNIGPQLEGARSSVAPSSAADANGGQATRRINAIDTVLNQPQDDHVLQKSVAKHIISSLSKVDSSNWVVRQVSRDEQGWTFTHVCKDSKQAWDRHASKNPAKTPIGAWSNKDGQDPVNLGRPAFDCRGSVRITFVESTRMISVKYDHTPMHKTVAQLLELMAPPPPEPVPVPPTAPKLPKEKAPRAPKAPKEPRPPKTPRSSKKRQAENGAPDGEGSQPKKRRKKKDSAVPTADGSVVPPEMPGALPVGDSSERQYYNTQQPGGANGTESGGTNSYPESLVDTAGADADARSESQGVLSANESVHSQSILNLPPGEAARRRDVAINLLSSGGIDPQSLSFEQFNIFANQFPELQQESLDMLAKYGAERLRIVHPSKDVVNPDQRAPTDGHDGLSQPAGDSNQSQPSTPSSTKSKNARKDKIPGVARLKGLADASIATAKADAVSLAAVVAGVAGSGKTPKAVEGLNRGACEACRLSKKQKCNKGKPNCSQCIASKVECRYPTAKPRASPSSKVASNTPEPSEVAEAPEAPEVPEIPAAIEEAVPIGIEQHDEPDDLGSPGFHHSHSELVSHPIDLPSTSAQNSGIYHHASDLSYPKHEYTTASEVPRQPTAASLEYMNTVSASALHEFAYPLPAQEPTLSYPEPASTIVHPEQVQPTQQPSRTRRSLPSTQPAQKNTTNSDLSNAQVNNTCQTMSNSPALPATSKPSPRQAQTRQPVRNTTSLEYDDLRQQQSSTWETAAQHSARPLITPPFQAAAPATRAEFQQANRAQGRTPVQNPTQAQGTPSHSGNTAFSSTTAVSTTLSYEYSLCSTTQAEPTSSRVAYEPYADQPSSAAASNSYSPYDNYSSRSANGTTGTSYNISSSSNQPSQSLQGFSVRPQPVAQVRSFSSTYGQQAHQQQAQAQHRSPTPQQSQQQQGYGNYSTQPHAGNSQQNQQGRYGFNMPSNSSSGYNSPAVSGNNAYSNVGSHAHGSAAAAAYSQQQQSLHQSMNLSSHTYSSSIDRGKQATLELLRQNNQSG